MEALKYLVSLVNDVLGMNKLQSGDLKDSVEDAYKRQIHNHAGRWLQSGCSERKTREICGISEHGNQMCIRDSLFPGTLPKNLRILQDCIGPFLQQSCYHFYLFRIHEKVPMNY